mmetsp:Transcript_27123/g.42198  ORF Transcript_27123/g.42198 Transcript_27123/m.42198 type:complete len:310 (-) Transcript_27123:25-954(-)
MYDETFFQALHRRLSGIQRILVVLSGKGGVGKSTVTIQLASNLAASLQHKSVGILDIDLCGPDVPSLAAERMGEIVSTTNELPGGPEEVWIPCVAERSQNPGASMYYVSLAQLLSSDADAVIWRGARKDAMINELFKKVAWERIPAGVEYLIIDTPPGTSDEHLTLFQLLSAYEKWRSNLASSTRLAVGCVIVTTPQLVATDDVAKMLAFCQTIGESGCAEIIGLVENMSGSYECPHCQSMWPVFSTTDEKSPAESLAERKGVPFLGSIPITAQWSKGLFSEAQSKTHPSDLAMQLIIGKVDVFFSERT